jgi:hypothetical protein
MTWHTSANAGDASGGSLRRPRHRQGHGVTSYYMHADADRAGRRRLSSRPVAARHDAGIRDRETGEGGKDDRRVLATARARQVTNPARPDPARQGMRRPRQNRPDNQYAAMCVSAYVGRHRL